MDLTHAADILSKVAHLGLVLYHLKSICCSMHSRLISGHSITICSLEMRLSSASTPCTDAVHACTECCHPVNSVAQHALTDLVFRLGWNISKFVRYSSFISSICLWKPQAVKGYEILIRNAMKWKILYLLSVVCLGQKTGGVLWWMLSDVFLWLHSTTSSSNWKTNSRMYATDRCTTDQLLQHPPVRIWRHFSYCFLVEVTSHWDTSWKTF